MYFMRFRAQDDFLGLDIPLAIGFKRFFVLIEIWEFLAGAVSASSGEIEALVEASWRLLKLREAENVKLVQTFIHHSSNSPSSAPGFE